MMNMTGEVWDYNDVNHTARYSCPVCNDCETDVFATYGYPAILATGQLIVAWAYNKGADYFWERAPVFVRERAWPTVRDGFGNMRRGIGQAVDGWRERINAWRMAQQMEHADNQQN